MFVSGYESIENVGGVYGFRDEGVVVGEEFADENVSTDREERSDGTREAVDVFRVSNVDRAVERVDHPGQVGRYRDD